MSVSLFVIFSVIFCKIFCLCDRIAKQTTNKWQAQMTFNEDNFNQVNSMACDTNKTPPATILILSEEHHVTAFADQQLDEKFNCTLPDGSDRTLHHLKPPVKQLACGHRQVIIEGASMSM